MISPGSNASSRLSSHLDRRRLFAALGSLVRLAALSQVPVTGTALAAPRTRGGAYPFTLGIASGDPTDDGIALWTRLVPELFSPDGGMPTARVPVDWEVAADERLRHVVRKGTVSALPELAHSVHVEVDGLEPDRTYWFRFRYRGDVSPVGRTHTTPRPGDNPRALRFAFASCQDWSHGFYSAYHHMAGSRAAGVDSEAPDPAGARLRTREPAVVNPS